MAARTPGKWGGLARRLLGVGAGRGGRMAGSSSLRDGIGGPSRPPAGHRRHLGRSDGLGYKPPLGGATSWTQVGIASKNGKGAHVIGYVRRSGEWI